MAFPLSCLAARDPVQTCQVEANGQPATLLCTLRAEIDLRSSDLPAEALRYLPIMSMLSNGRVENITPRNFELSSSVSLGTYLLKLMTIFQVGAMGCGA